MRNITFKRQLLFVMFVLLGCLSIQAANDDLITQQVTIKLDEAGTLSTKIGSNKKYKITNLKIVGNINGTDWAFIRDMFYDHSTRSGGFYFPTGKLETLDLSEANIVEGGNYYYYNYPNGYYRKYYTKNNTMGDYMFYESTIKTLYLPKTVVNFESAAFNSSSGLTDVYVDNIETWLHFKFASSSANPMSVAKHLYLNREEFKETVEIPNGVKTINPYAFWHCTDVRALIIPSTLESIGKFAFGECTYFNTFLRAENISSELIFPSIKEIGAGAFSGCKELQYMSFPNIKRLESSTFSGCKNLKYMAIPDSVSTIPEYVFDGCTNLSLIWIPKKLSKIERNAFSGCSSLREVEVEDLDSWYKVSFQDTPMNYASILEERKTPTSGSRTVTRVDFSFGMEYIDLNCIKNCVLITVLSIPSSVKKIEGAFPSKVSTIYMYNPNPISISNSVVGTLDKQKCVLFVPKGAKLDYWLADGWGDFENIEEFDATGINNIITSSDAKEVSRFSVNGQRLSAPTKGLNLVKYSDGSVKKVAVQ